MSAPQSTARFASSQGSTEPGIESGRRAREAARIREYWATRRKSQPPPELTSACFQRHKSLVLKLAREDYAHDRQRDSSGIDLQDYCQQYTWLGDPLAESVMRLLEVQEYFDEHPDVFGGEREVEWPTEGEPFLHFLILEELGRGASGRVYLAEQQNLGNKCVVLKVVAGRNVDEPSLLGKLRHPNITPIHWADYDPTHDVSYLCMPFLGRSTLVDLVRLAFQDGTPASGTIVRDAAQLWMSESDTRALDAAATRPSARGNRSYVTEVIRLARDLAAALAFVHEQQIIHGDIKPSNILLTPQGEPYLLDFNLSRSRHAWNVRFGGTPAYMAPEQLRAIADGTIDWEPTEKDYAADIYSFGVVLYEQLTGRPPHVPSAPREDIETLACDMVAAQAEGYEPLDGAVVHSDSGLAKLVASCLELQPESRPRSMQEVVETLDRLNAPRPRATRLIRRRPWLAAAAGTAIVGTLSVAAALALTAAPPAERLYLQAIQTREQGDLQQTVHLLNEVLLIDPDHWDARLLRARAYNEAHDYTKADVDLRHMLRRRFDPALQAYYAYNTHFLDDTDSAASSYQVAIQRDFKNSAVLNNLILDHFLSKKRATPQERIDFTEPLLREALELNPESPQVRMTAFTFYRRHPRSFDPDIVAATEEHVQWLAEHLPDNASVWKAIHGYYLAQATLGLIDSTKADSAAKHLAAASDHEPLPRFLDPLDCEFYPPR